MSRLLSVLALVLSLGTLPAHAQDFVSGASAVWVHDVTTGTTLLEQNADVPLPPASMSKLMTLYMAFEAIANGRLSIDEELIVSQHAMDYGGSSMFLRAGERVRVEDLLRGVVVLSGNDAATVLAEALSPDGTEAGFARAMTERGRQIGLTASTFANASGWPSPDHRMSVRDLGILAERLIRDFPTFYPLFAEEEFAFDNRVPANSQNRNPILSLGLGADGLKTGHTNEAGYGLVGSAKQGERRIVFVITGLDTEAARQDEATRILNWAFRQFALRDLGRAGTQMGEASIWMGDETQVALVLPEDLRLLMPALTPGAVEAEITYDGPVAAPVSAGEELARLHITRNGLPDIDLPLVAGADVAAGGFGVRMRAALHVLMTRIQGDETGAAVEGA